MIRYFEGTVFNTEAEVWVNTVNCYGVMGAGIALEFKIRFPEMYEEYVKMCGDKKYYVGRPRLHKTKEKYILNFPTKNHWKAPSKIEWIEEGLKYFVSNYKKIGIKSIAFPKLGTLNGGLDWKEVKYLMEKYLDNLEDIDITICLDEQQKAEGLEKMMVDAFNNISIEELKKTVKINKKQSIKLEEIKPVSRFWHLSKLEGVGIKTYESIFNYFYLDQKENEHREGYAGIEQMSLF